MKSIQCYLPVLLFTLLVSTSCRDDDDPTPSNVDGNIKYITENVDEVTTWFSDTIYVIKKYDFYVNNTLNIQPGTVVKFHPTDGPYMVLGGAGTVMANGTATAPIYFTSFKDDAHGGDTNKDSTATSPARKDWGFINMNGMSGSSFEYCHFLYGGNFGYSSTLTLDVNSVATVENCTFAHNDGSDGSGWYGALNANGAASGTSIRNNIFYDNVRPLSISTEFDLDASNIFHNPDNPSVTNTYNGIYAYSPSDIDNNVSWAETEVAYIIDDNDLWVEAGYRLTLADNVVIKMRPGSGWVLGEGTSSIINYDGPGVFFTSYKDDTHGGDTNGDGNLTAPGAGDWEGMFDNTLSIPSPYYFQWANLLYDNH